uniref:Uncharacterized protein n=1 Tax=viral metagenome TaxID=1070528 RepID=A0A6C0FD08_9ZZZZ|tara:strand:- start:15589 stop:15975 length:387 start_codon:yes stop_codon:yes gene_type:complete
MTPYSYEILSITINDKQISAPYSINLKEISAYILPLIYKYNANANANANGSYNVVIKLKDKKNTLTVKGTVHAKNLTNKILKMILIKNPKISNNLSRFLESQNGPLKIYYAPSSFRISKKRKRNNVIT